MPSCRHRATFEAGGGEDDRAAPGTVADLAMTMMIAALTTMTMVVDAEMTTMTVVVAATMTTTNDAGSGYSREDTKKEPAK